MRIRAQWTGTGLIGPSVSTFYWDSSVTGGPAAIRAFFNSCATQIPNTVTITVDSTGDILTDTTGALVGTWTESAGAAVTGSDNNSFVLGLGIRVVWNTAGIHNGRRVRGSTFLVPVGRDIWDAQGTPDSGHLATVSSAAAALVSAGSGDFKIWSRPTGGSGGQSHGVTGSSVPDAVSWLRSRRV